MVLIFWYLSNLYIIFLILIYFRSWATNSFYLHYTSLYLHHAWALGLLATVLVTLLIGILISPWKLNNPYLRIGLLNFVEKWMTCWTEQTNSQVKIMLFNKNFNIFQFMTFVPKRAQDPLDSLLGCATALLPNQVNKK